MTTLPSTADRTMLLDMTPVVTFYEWTRGHIFINDPLTQASLIEKYRLLSEPNKRARLTWCGRVVPNGANVSAASFVAVPLCRHCEAFRTKRRCTEPGCLALMTNRKKVTTCAEHRQKIARAMVCAIEGCNSSPRKNGLCTEHEKTHGKFLNRKRRKKR